MLPVKDQKSAKAVRRQLSDLIRKINAEISPVYTSRRIKDDIKVREDKPPLVNKQCVVYCFKRDLCGAGFVDLHQRIEDHKDYKGSAVGNHLREQRDKKPDDIEQGFKILRKCQNKLYCLILELLFYQH